MESPGGGGGGGGIVALSATFISHTVLKRRDRFSRDVHRDGGNMSIFFPG